MKAVALISDTHGLLRPEVVEALAGVERILHMGDVGDPDVLEQLRELAPVHAVRGNVDHGAWARRLPRTEVVELFGASAYLLHNLGALDIDPSAAGMRFVFFGHTHQPSDEPKGGVRYVNPGSIGPRRFDKPVSYALLDQHLSVRFVTL